MCIVCYVTARLQHYVEVKQLSVKGSVQEQRFPTGTLDPVIEVFAPEVH